MKTHIAIAVLNFVLFLMPASAEFYEYKDDSGCLYYTDNLIDVLEVQQFDLKSLQEIPLESAGLNEVNREIMDSEQRKAETVDSGGKESRKTQAEALDKEQAVLNQTYEALHAEKMELGDPSLESAKFAEKVAYQTRVEVLNRKIAEYEEQRRLFEEKVANFITEGIQSQQ